MSLLLKGKTEEEKRAFKERVIGFLLGSIFWFIVVIALFTFIIEKCGGG